MSLSDPLATALRLLDAIAARSVALPSDIGRMFDGDLEALRSAVSALAAQHDAGAMRDAAVAALTKRAEAHAADAERLRTDRRPLAAECAGEHAHEARLCAVAISALPVAPAFRAEAPTAEEAIVSAARKWVAAHAALTDAAGQSRGAVCGDLVSAAIHTVQDAAGELRAAINMQWALCPPPERDSP